MQSQSCSIRNNNRVVLEVAMMAAQVSRESPRPPIAVSLSKNTGIICKAAMCSVLHNTKIRSMLDDTPPVISMGSVLE